MADGMTGLWYLSRFFMWGIVFLAAVVIAAHLRKNSKKDAPAQTREKTEVSRL